MKKIKASMAAFCIAAAGLYCLVPGGTRATADILHSGVKTNFVLVIPSIPPVVKLAHDVAEMRKITLVAFRKRPDGASLSLYVWRETAWSRVEYADFTSMKFMKSAPGRVVIIGGDEVVPDELLKALAWPAKIARIKSALAADIINGLNVYFNFSPQEFQKLSRAHGLTPVKLDSSPEAVSAPASPPVGAGKDKPPEAVKPVPAADIEKKTAPDKKKAPGVMAGAAAGELRLDLGDDVSVVFIRLEALSIWAGRDEVTHAQYKRFDRAYDSKKYYEHVLNLPDQPAVMISWEDAVNYCGWLNRNFHEHLPPGCEFRLPVEKEWMAFALCGLEKEYPWGNQWPPPNAFNYKGMEGSGIFYNMVHDEKFIRNHDDGFIVAAPVGKSGKNEWGLYGVGGNVWEWCQDWFDETRTARVLKGGAWNNSDKMFLAVTNRSAALPDKSNAMIGFRVVIAPRGK
jgi:hypothetical protein